MALGGGFLPIDSGAATDAAGRRWLQLGAGDKGISFEIEAQEFSGPNAGVGHADPGACDHFGVIRPGPGCDEEIVALHVMAVQSLVDLHGTAEETGAAGSLYISDRLQGA